MATRISRRTILAAAGASLLLPDDLPADDDTRFVPAFENQNWVYQSFLVLPTPKESAAKPGSAVTSKKWAMGKVELKDGKGNTATGQLSFAPSVGLKVTASFEPGKNGAPAPFKATGTGVEGVTTGSVYELTGWALPGADGKVEAVRGAVMAVRGPDTSPKIELGRMPIGTVGAFMITKAK